MSKQISTDLSITKGKISVFYGPMFSGKSSSLLKKIKKNEDMGKKVLVINYAPDNRYSTENVMCTHDKETHKATKCYQLEEIENIYMKYDVIAIDEGQFFLDCAQRCDQYANNGKKVYVGALEATFERKDFNGICQLLPIAEKIKKLYAKCNMCEGKASFTQRKVQSSEIELIGGEDIYQPLCRSCFNKTENLTVEVDTVKQPRKNSCSSQNSTSTNENEKNESCSEDKTSNQIKNKEEDPEDQKDIEENQNQ